MTDEYLGLEISDWVALALIFAALCLFALELVLPSGALGLAGAALIIVAGLLLVNGGDLGDLPWQVHLLAGVLLLLAVVVLGGVVRIRGIRPIMGIQAMVGRRGVARSDLDPKGFVYVNGEYWSAESEDGSVHEGDSVVVTAVKGLSIKVRKQSSEGATT